MSLEALAELGRRREAEAGPGWVSALFGAQRSFYEDPAKKKAALCSRRAGKTEGVAAWLLQGAADAPNQLSVYIALTRNNARLILWDTLQRLDKRHDVGLWFRELDGQLMVQHPNGHRIWLAGCKDSSEVEKFRGPFYRRAAIDEAASYGPYLRTLIDDVLEPALLDLNGELALVGTPSAIPAGLFYEATTGDGGPRWSTHHWTVLDNPYIPHAGAWLEQKREANRWDEKHPTYQREWLGRWVRDENALVYPYDGSRNAYSGDPPDGDWRKVCAIDLGSSQSEPTTAFTIGASRKRHPDVYLLKSWKRAGMTPSRIAAEIERIRIEDGVRHFVVDPGALGDGYIREFQERFGQCVVAAEKRSKRAFIEMMAGDLLAGTLKVHPFACRELIDEWLLLQWNEDRSASDERFLDHCADSALYCWRDCRSVYRPEHEPPAPGSPEAVEAEMRALKKAAEARVRRTKREQLRRRYG